MATVEAEGGHTPLDITHLNTLVPTPRPVICVVGELGVTIVPEPPSKVQLPVPTVGAFAAMVAVVAQTDCEGPATEVVGKS